MTTRKTFCVLGIFWTLWKPSSASALWARVTLPNGQQYVGEWLDGNGEFFRLRLAEGNEVRLSMSPGTVVEFVEREGATTPVEAVLRVNAALDALQVGLKESAETAFREALALAPKYARAHYEYGRYLELVGRQEEAFEHYVLAARFDPQTYSVRERLLMAAKEALSRNDLAAAGRALSEYARDFPNEPDAPQSAYEAARYMALVAEKTKENDPLRQEALRAFELALRQYPHYGAAEETFFRLASLYLAWKQPEKAVLVLTELLNRFPDGLLDLETHLALGQAYLQSGNRAAALEEARRVVQRTVDPSLLEQARALAAEAVWTVLDTYETLPSNEIHAVARDGKAIWVGTANGVTKLDAATGAPILTGVPNLPGGTVVRAIAVDNREVWFGTANRGVIRYRKDIGTTKIYGRLDGLPSHHMIALDMDENDVWVGGSGGVARFNRVTGEWIPYRTGREFPGREVTCLAVTPFSVWVGTQNAGVFRFDRIAERWDVFTTQHGIGSNSIRSIAVSTSSIVVSWNRASENGYSEWDNGTRQWTTYPLGPDEIAPQDISVSVSGGTLWVATGELLLSRNVRGKWSNVEYPSAVRGSRVHVALADGEYVWIGTSEGLARADIRALTTLERLQ